MSETLVKHFLEWIEKNGMFCNPSKCKELTVLERQSWIVPSCIRIPSCTYVSILGVTFQSDCRFNTHVKCLYVLRCLRKEGYKQVQIDFLFDSLVLPRFHICPYGASDSDLTPLQCFFRSLETEFYYKKSQFTINFTEAVVFLKRFLRPPITPVAFYSACKGLQFMLMLLLKLL